MKKVLFPILALVLAFGLALPMTAPTAAHTEDEPQEVTLWAGQNMDVGDVKVWNDGENLYVKYETDGDWELMETHLAVANSLGGIPQTKTGNPIPGKFEWSMEHDPWVTEYTYTIDLGDWEPRTDLYIAAHAVVVNVGNPMTTTVVSDTTTEVTAGNTGATYPHNAVFAWEPGPNYPNDGSDDSSWGQNSLWDQNIDYDFSGSGADWIWESYRVQNPITGDVVDFKKTFNIPGVPTGATLYITCDNGYEAFINGNSVGSAQVHGAWRTSDLTESYVNSQGWQSVESWDISGLLVPGQNTLDIDTANEYMGSLDGESNGTINSNPAGLIFTSDITWVQEETAWGEGLDFPGKNWAMYFEYHIQEPCVSGEVINGGFETPVVTAYQGWDIFPSGTENLGWTVEWYGGQTSWGSWTRPEPAHLELHRGVLGAAYEGEQYAELDTDWNGPGGGLNNEPASVRIYQDIDTCPNKTYTLTYAWRLRPNYGDNELEVWWNGSKLATRSGSGGGSTIWNPETHSGLTVTGTTTRLEFIETGKPDSLGMFLDAVSLVEE